MRAIVLICFRQILRYRHWIEPPQTTSGIHAAPEVPAPRRAKKTVRQVRVHFLARAFAQWAAGHGTTADFPGSVGNSHGRLVARRQNGRSSILLLLSPKHAGPIHILEGSPDSLLLAKIVDCLSTAGKPVIVNDAESAD